MNPRKRLEEVRARLADIQTEVTQLDSMDAPSEDEAARAETLSGEFADFRAEETDLVAKVAALDAVRTAALDPANTTPGFHTVQVMTRTDPFDNLDAVRTGHLDASTLRSRALTGIEKSAEHRPVPQEWAERATRMVENNLPGVQVVDPAEIARIALLRGSPAYRTAWEKIVSYPESYAGLLTGEESEAVRAALSTTDANGGYAIPFLLDTQIILSNTGSANPFRQIAHIVAGSAKVWHGLSSAGVSAEWKTEGSAAADASPTLAQPTITAYLADAFVRGSFEVLSDTSLANELPRLFADAKDRLEDAAFATGTGSQPIGVVAAVGAVTTSRVSATTAGTFGAASEVYKVSSALRPRDASRASWIANRTTINAIRQFGTTLGSSFIADLAMGQPPALLGQPLYEAYSMTATVTTGSDLLLAGDFSRYYIYDHVGGSSMEYVPNLFDTTTGLPTGQRGWIYWWRTGANAVDTGAFRVLRL